MSERGRRNPVASRLSRRELLGAAAASALPGAVRAATPGRPPLSMQFFSFTALAAGGWDKYSAAMETARRIGYDGLELAGLSGYTPDQIRRRATELGLDLPSLHMGNDQVRAFAAPAGSPAWAGTFAEAQDATYTPLGLLQVCRVNAPLARDLGCRWGVVAAGGRLNFANADAVRRFCDAMNQGLEPVRQAGLKLAYHTHAVEFTPMADGQVPFDLMVREIDPAVRFQVDLGWVAAAGLEPAAVIRKHGARIGLLHLKDADAQRRIATCGDGVVDFAAVRAAAAEIPDMVYVVERDGAPGLDPVREATRAYQYLHRLGWGARA